MSAQEFFDTLESRVDASKTAGMNNSYLFDIDVGGDVHEDGERRAEPDERLHDREAEGQGRHGGCDEAPEALLVTLRAPRGPRRRRPGHLRQRGLRGQPLGMATTAASPSSSP